MSTTIGQKFRQERLARELSLEEVAKGTHIRLRFLEAIEEGRFERLPSAVQARGFVRVYAGFLDMDPAPLLETLNNGEGLPAAVESAAEPVPQAHPTPEPGTAEQDAIMAEIGAGLRGQREILGLSREDVERQTHLRPHYLKALEEGRLDGLPSPVQGRGMLHNYARFLGLDPDPLLLRFADALQSRLAEQQATRPKTETQARRSLTLPAPLRRVISADVLIGGVMIVVLAGFVIWGAIRINAMREVGEPSPTVPSIAEALIQDTETPAAESAAGGAVETTPVSQVTPTEVRPGGAPPATPEARNTGEAISTLEEEIVLPEGEGGSIQISLVVRQRAWLRVTVDGDVELEGRVIPGSAYTFSGEQEVEILTGNGAALQVFFNQQDLGPMGIFGEVVDRVFTPEGEVLPTPTITLTPTTAPTDAGSSAATGTPGAEATQTPQPTPAP